MIWTIILLIVGIALFLFGGMLLNKGGKKPANDGNIIIKKIIKLISIILISGCVCRLYTPYYMTNVNPNILKEMVTAMQAQQEAEKNKAVRSYVRSNMGEMVADAPIWGDENAKKTIFLWSDYSCPYCRRVHEELAKVMAERKDVRVVLKNFSIHGELSDAPAKAVIAAKLQGNEKAAALDKLLMEKGYFKPEDMKDRSKMGAKVMKNVLALATEAGLNADQLERDMKGAVVARELKNVRDLANRFEISGTPFLIVGEQAFPGAVSAEKINEALDK